MQISSEQVEQLRMSDFILEKIDQFRKSDSAQRQAEELRASPFSSGILSYNYHKAVPSNTALTPSKPNTDTSSRTVAQKLGNWELRAQPNLSYPSNTTEGSKQSTRQDLNTYPTSYLNGRSKDTLMLTHYRMEMSSRTSPASRKLLQAVPNETSQQEESNATTLTSIGAACHRQSEKKSHDEQ
ncbi:hypothetical protein F511_17105 [Dorcoceras hygrometricum]|uniref:Uncharacterized protein n=1 Tax=Dorcoceras hygrometricum TaxID=472368 RepID=A0A2Z7BGW8_9LAMI|nr:hypothetical protein F511_17105 [Dorcoceras hygrometricum]